MRMLTYASGRWAKAERGRLHERVLGSSSLSLSMPANSRIAMSGMAAEAEVMHAGADAAVMVAGERVEGGLLALAVFGGCRPGGDFTF